MEFTLKIATLLKTNLKQIQHGVVDGATQLWTSITTTVIRWRQMGLRQFALTHKFQLFVVIASVTGYFLHSLLLALFIISFLADAYVGWIIKTRLVVTLNSTAWYEIFLSQITSFVLTGVAVYLIVHPLPQRGPLVALLWFFLFALKRVLLAIGFGSMSEDLVTTLQSEKYTGELPADPPHDDASTIAQ